MAETLGKSVDEIEQMDSKRFENWRTYYSVKSTFEKRAVEVEREKAQMEAKVKALPRGTMYWKYSD